MIRSACRTAGAVLLATLAGRPALAQEGATLTAFTWLPATTRSAGMAGAGVALNGDAGAVFINPAGLATIRHTSIDANVLQAPDRSVVGRAAGALRLYKFDLGGGLQYLRYTQPAPLTDELWWTAAAVYRFGMIALSGNVMYASVLDTSGQTDRSVSGGLGFQLAVFDIMAIGGTVQNFASKTITGNGVDQPVNGRIGFMFNFVDPQSNARLLITLEGVYSEGQEPRLLMGLEAGAVLKGIGVVIRGGYGSNPPASMLGDWSVGASLILSKHAAVDYAWLPDTPLGGPANQLGVRLTL
ncbi:MAG: hypothetical protein ACHQ2E_04185 [Gemmatimonadales bacterium]